LRTQQIPRDYEALLKLVDASPGKPVLIGVSEGAGLSVVAAADPAVKPRIAGVVALGLGDVNELAWHWRDSIIYVTKGTPKEPAFHATDFISHLAPAPVALLRSAHDEYVPAGESEQIFASASEPKKLWTVDAANHRFAGNLLEFDVRLVEALAWIAHNSGNH
jgi:dienelactone hydrolase